MRNLCRSKTWELLTNQSGENDHDNQEINNKKEPQGKRNQLVLKKMMIKTHCQVISN